MQDRSGLGHSLSEASLGKAVLDHLDGLVGGAELTDVLWDGAHSSEVFELRFSDGRSLMVKRAKHDWARARFEASSRAAALLREQTDIVVPRPIRLPEDLGPRPLQAYWRIAHPTLGELWDDLTQEERRSAMRSLGSLLARLHQVRLDAWGPLTGEGAEHDSLDTALEWDLGSRLLPAVRGHWPSAVRHIEDLLARIPELSSRLALLAPKLAHNDVHMSNVLCDVRHNGGRSERGVRCVGLLDLDSAGGAPAESDAASLDVLHGPHFHQHLPRAIRDCVWDGYRRELDPWAVVFFRAVHLANLGFYSALVGHHHHAGEVREALALEMDRLSGGVDSHLGALGSTVGV